MRKIKILIAPPPVLFVAMFITVRDFDVGPPKLSRGSNGPI